MAGKLPFMQFYVRDWLSDLAVRACRPQARSLWMDMLCIMHQSPRRGYLLDDKGISFTVESLARVTGMADGEVAESLDELSRRGVYSCDSHGTIYSRRMVNHEPEREASRLRKRKQREIDVTGDVTPDVTHVVTSMSRGRDQRPDTRDQNKSPPTPLAGGGECERIFSAYPRHVGKRVALQAISKALARLAKDGRSDASVWLLGRVQAYAKAVQGKDTQFIPHPATWMNQERYHDEDRDWSAWRTAQSKPDATKVRDRDVSIYEKRVLRFDDNGSPIQPGDQAGNATQGGG